MTNRQAITYFQKSQGIAVRLKLFIIYLFSFNSEIDRNL